MIRKSTWKCQTLVDVQFNKRLDLENSVAIGFLIGWETEKRAIAKHDLDDSMNRDTEQNKIKDDEEGEWQKLHAMFEEGTRAYAFTAPATRYINSE